MARTWAIVGSAFAIYCGVSIGGTLIAPAAHASPSYLQPCSDKDKLSVDPSTGTELVCTGSVWDQAPSVPAGIHATGTRCQSEGIDSTSDDSYLILCSSGLWIRFHE